MKKRTYFRVLSTWLLMIILAFGISAANTQKVYAIGGIGSPTDGSSYQLGDTVNIDIQPVGQISLGGISISGRVDIQLGKTLVYSKEFSTSGTNQHVTDTFTPESSGTYTMTVHVTYTLSGQQIDTDTYTSTFQVKAVSLAKTKPVIAADWKAKGKATISCANSSGYSMEVYRATAKKGTYKLIKKTSKAAYTDQKLSSDKAYYYKVRLYTKKNGKTTYSKYSSVVKLEKYSSASKTSNKPTIASLSYSASKGVKITWAKTAGAGYYLVCRGTQKEGVYDTIACCGENELVWYDKDVEKGKTYYYQILAMKGDEDLVAKGAIKSYTVPK